MKTAGDVKTVDVSFQLGKAHCANTAACERMVSRNRERLVGRYIGAGGVNDGQIIAAILDLRELHYEDYILTVKKSSKGENIRQARRATKKGYYCKPFVRRLFLPDIVEINQSKETRSGGVMKSSYKRGVEELGGYPTQALYFNWPDCAVHYDVWWGIFKDEPGYRQGEVETNEKLLGYINLRRVGNYGLYSYIIGHGDYLRDGIMYEMHLTAIKWLLNAENRYGWGFDYLVYAGYNQGGGGLQHWKRKFGFEGAYLRSADLVNRQEEKKWKNLVSRLWAYVGRAET